MGNLFCFRENGNLIIIQKSQIKLVLLPDNSF